MAIDKSGNLYIADWTGNRVRKVSSGKISTLAGTSVSGYSGDGGAAINALLNGPQGVAVDSTGNVYIADASNNVIRKVTSLGTITTFASSPNFRYPTQMATDSSNNLYVADYGACAIWKITPQAVVSIAAGVSNSCGYNGDGLSATSALLNQPSSVAVDDSGNLLIADAANNRIRQVSASGIIAAAAIVATAALQPLRVRHPRESSSTRPALPAASRSLLLAVPNRGRQGSGQSARRGDRRSQYRNRSRQDLSLNRYKEVVHNEVAHRPPKEILADLAKLEMEIQQGMQELEGMLG